MLLNIDAHYSTRAKFVKHRLSALDIFSNFANIRWGAKRLERLHTTGGTMSDEAKGRASTESFGAYLKSLRTGAELSLRDVEEATNKDVSNAYLSQLENGKISKPSPNILHSLATVYGADYTKIMRRAGYVAPGGTRTANQKHGKAATFSIDNLNEEEERELLKYLSWVRSQREKS